MTRAAVRRAATSEQRYGHSGRSAGWRFAEGCRGQGHTGRPSGRPRSARAAMERGPAVPFGTVFVGLNGRLGEGLARILSAADFHILASASAVDDPGLSSLPRERPILLIIDVSDDFDAALAQIVSFKHRYPAGRVAVLAHQHQLTDMVSAFRMGANAYLVKITTCDTFIKSLELVMLGVTLLPSEILTFISEQQDRNRSGGAPGH